MSSIDETLAQCSCQDTSITFTQVEQLWRDPSQPCQSALQQTVFTLPDGSVGFSVQGLGTAQGVMDDLYTCYKQQGFRITDANQPGFNAFQDVILDECQALPGACDLFLQRDVCFNQSRIEIASSQALLNFCGCYAPPLDESLSPCPPSAPCPACDPLCARSNTVQRSNKQGGALQCTNNVCVIDDVSVTAAKTSLTQICTQCITTPCTCIIGSVNISSTLAESGVSITQECSNSRCLQLSPTGGVPTSVPCPSSGRTPSQTISNVWLAAGAIIVALIVILFFVISARR